MKYPHQFLPVTAAVDQVEVAVRDLATRLDLPPGFIGTVRAAMRTVRSEIGVPVDRPLHAVEQGYVQQLADALHDLTGFLRTLEKEGPGTDISLEQERRLLRHVDGALARVRTIMGAPGH